MTFTSIAFILFFVSIVTLYYITPGKFRWAILLLGSCYFYMAFIPKYILVLFALILIDFILAQKIENSIGKNRKPLFIGSIVSNVGMLFVFKYFNFFNENIHIVADLLHWNYSISALSLVLPLGLSFHTFQSLSYVIEVYRGKYKAEKHLGFYALYVLFFPQLVAGPIERPEHLLPQLKEYFSFKISNIIYGLRLMAWGFFKKLVIADRLAVSVTYVYGHIGDVPGLSILITIIFFAFQLYADFSGYSDIARGAARTLGIDVTRNFNQPYFATSVAEFWRKWHISLSNWFRDYFYFPLAYSKSRATRPCLYFCLITTFLVTGLWHGAGWTFVIMGALHGLYIVSGLISKPIREYVVNKIWLYKVPQIHRLLQTLFTFSLVSLSWIFFRSPNLQTALQFIEQLFIGWSTPLTQFIKIYQSPFDILGFSGINFLLSIIGIVFLLLVEYFQNKKPIGGLFDTQSLFIKSFVYSSLVLILIIFSMYSSEQFIYFQF